MPLLRLGRYNALITWGYSGTKIGGYEPQYRNHLITAMAKYRMSSHDFKIERGRYNKPTRLHKSRSSRSELEFDLSNFRVVLLM